MAKRAKKAQSYYRQFASDLSHIILDYRDNRNSLFATSNYAVFNTLDKGITRHPLRYYQKEALYILDYLYNESICEIARLEKAVRTKYTPMIERLLDTIDKDSSVKAPFIGYEMATGSGKTMLMGAAIYLLNQKYDINNFLIITPASTDIYQKTIRNFSVGNFESVWADDTPFRFNIITGDNYTQNLFYNKNVDANIFIFNISKFGTNATNTTKTWESAIWRDENGNSISIKQFLKDKKLVIITDEAHHAQNRASNNIIKRFHPTAVLEYTATAVEDTRNEEKKNQTIVYKYDIKRLLEDGHGKLVKAVALASQNNKKARTEIPSSEKLKIITLFLIHLLKKKAILLDEKSKGMKPLAFVKVKDETTYAKKIFDYITNELSNDIDNINVILEKVHQQDLEITSLVRDMYDNDYKGKIDLLRKDVETVAKTAIFYHGKSDAETEKKFAQIRSNPVEIVVYMQRLDEGIDLPNIYSMAVINDTDSELKTSVKQIIGRGIRINKEVREFDDIDDPLKQQAEKLHIVCDQGKNFEEVIEAIQKEFGLSNKYLSFDKEKKLIPNKAKSDLLEQRFIPHIKADFRVKDQVNLFDLINDTGTVVNNFLENNCFSGESDEQKRFLKYRPDSFFQEVDIFSEKSEYHKQLQQGGGKPATLTISPREVKAIYGHVLGNLYCMPDIPKVKDAFQTYIDKFNEIGLQYYYISPSDEKLALNLFVSGFSFFYRHHIEKNYFKIEFRDIREDENWNLKTRFSDYDLKLPEDQIAKTAWKKITDKEKLKSMVEGGFNFFGYDNSVYDYNSFDSFSEKQLADYVDEVLKGSVQGSDSSVASLQEPTIAAEAQAAYGRSPAKNCWIKNKRNIYFTYGSKKYYPDFILIKDDITYVIEAKGEIFSDTKKNLLLKKLDEIDNYKGVLVFSHQLNLMQGKNWDFEKFITYAEDVIRKHQNAADLIKDPPEAEKYIKYVPAYSPLKAYKKFIKEQKTPKPEGWLEVEPRENGYPKTIIATQVKGDGLSPAYSHNSWILLNTSFDPKILPDQIALVHSEAIEDGYEGNLTIRLIDTWVKDVPGNLFGERMVSLKPLNPELPTFEISEAQKGGVEVVGVVLQLSL